MEFRKLTQFFLVLTLFFPDSHSARFGSRAKTLFFPPGSDQPQESFTRIRRNTDQVSQATSRHKRESGNGIGDSTGPSVQVTAFDLDDHHPELLVHWVGEGRDEIICLTRDITLSATSDSNVHISYDYGTTFEKKQLRYPSGASPVFDRFYHSSASITRYIFNDIENQAVWTTTDVGLTFRHYNVTFRPSVITMHESDENVVLAMDDRDEERRLWLSENFGVTWRVVQRDVKSFYWGVEPYDKPSALYVEREEPGGLASVLRSEDYFEDFRYDIVITGVKDFEVREDYLFATKPVESGKQELLDLWVSHQRGEFRKGVFPGKLQTKGFYVADASEEQVFVCINHDDYRSNLYISEAQGYEFSLSLADVVYFSPEGPGKDSWLSQYADEPFADLYKVQGLRGIYVASQFLDTQGEFEEANMNSMITFDKGGEWMPLQSPDMDLHGQPINCTGNCSLHLSQRVGRYRPGSRLVPMVSKKSAPGIILGTGVVGTNLDDELTQYSVFLSNTAGASWHQVLIGRYFYIFGDHGGVITAVKQYGSTNEVEYSVTEGQFWHKETFSEERIYVYGLMTEPGEISSTFTVFGSEVGEHSWLIVQIKTRPVLLDDCTDDDYKTWWPGEELPDVKCLLGRKTIYERRNPDSICFNGRDYDRPIQVENCTCSREDYECDEGYMEQGWPAELCVKDPEDATDPGAAPVICPEGESFRRSKGYRKVQGDTCQGGDSNYEPEQVACPVARNPEFLLFSQRTEIHRYLLASEQDERLPINNLKLIATLDYDVANNCYYYADTVDDVIKKFCPNGGRNEETILVANDIDMVEGLAFDWLALNIYWVDSQLNKIEVARHDGRLRRTIVNQTDLDEPRGLALDPKKGYMYWADWGSAPKIVRAYMDGTHVTAIVSNNIHWPNGVAIDEQTGRLYWTDAYYHRVESSFSDGSGRYVVLAGELPHPFAIGIYKDRMYWDDWTSLTIESANKHDGSDRRVELDDLDGVMDLKVFHNSSQQGTNPCSRTGGCSQLCLVHPNETLPGGVGRHCLCADNFKRQVNSDGSERCLCEGDETMDANGTCTTHSGSCASNQIHCGVGEYCVPLYWQCDGDMDCPDGSDERDCPGTSTCGEDEFACRTNVRCIPAGWVCDHDNDCHDNSDEEGCPVTTCQDSQFSCDNGRCIPGNWQCDFDNDCGDMSDEQGCFTTVTVPVGRTCSPSQFTCGNDRCIPITWVCDQDNDCGDMSDEQNCNTTTSCSSYQFQCDSGRCIPSWWRCDGYDDCGEGSDEESCSMTTVEPANTTFYPFSCGESSFSCNNGQGCIPVLWICDWVNDCSDGSDEWDCPDGTDYPTGSCSAWQFSCDNGNCIPGYWECDNYDDCGDSSDERSCATEYPFTTEAPISCQIFKVPCGRGETPRCIWSWWVCDGEPDCSGGSDEEGCVSEASTTTVVPTPPASCSSSQFRCVSSGRCIYRGYRCNGHADCSDLSDEIGCATEPATPTSPSCPPNYFGCSSWDQGNCIDDLMVCDGQPQCRDVTDENNCNSDYSVSSFSVTQGSSTAAIIEWVPGNRVPSSYYTYKLYMRDLSVTPFPPSQSQLISSSLRQYQWSNLIERHQYEFTIAIVSGGVEYRKAQLVTITLQPDETPSAPQNLMLLAVPLEHGGYGVNVSWERPLHNYDNIRTYEVYHHELHSTLGDTTLVRSPASYKLFYTLQQNLYYAFKVRAVNPVGPGEYSEEDSIFVGDANVPSERPQHLDVTTGTNYADLEWEALDAVIGYQVFYYPGYNSSAVRTWNVSGNAHQTRVSGLCEGTQYVFQVAGYNSRGVGPKSDATGGNTEGQSLPSIQSLRLEAIPKEKQSSVKLVWTTSPYDGTVKYQVFHGSNAIQLSVLWTTDETKVTVSGLNNGEEHFFSVRASGGQDHQCFGVESAVQSIYLGPVGDPDPPRDLAMTKTFTSSTVVGKATALLTWKSPWDTPTDLAYRVSYQINGTVDVSTVNIAVTGDTKLSYNLTDLIPGTLYSVSVKTGRTNAHSSSPVTFYTASYKAPEKFKAEQLDSFVVLSWDPSPDEIASSLGFSVFLMNVTEVLGIQYNATLEESTKSLTRLVRDDRRLVNVANTTDEVHYIKDLAPNQLYFFTVAIGYYDDRYLVGAFAEKEFVNFTVFDAGGPKPGTPAPRTGDNSGSVLLIITIASVGFLVILLAAALVYFVVRHQRLQRSFMSFANSHYDTRSGTATFSPEENTNDLGSSGEEDQPIIRGFSDDEPLVVA